MPKPSQIVGSLSRVVPEEDVLGRSLLTAKESLVATTLLTIVGVTMGCHPASLQSASAGYRDVDRRRRIRPGRADVPLFLVIFGRSAWTIIMMGFVAGLPPVILKTIEGLSATRAVLVNVGLSFNLTAAQLFWKIQFPSALATIFVGLRLGLIFALINVVGVEFLINFGGLGQLINDLAERYDLPGTYAAISFVILVSVFFFIAAERAERWLTHLA